MCVYIYDEQNTSLGSPRLQCSAATLYEDSKVALEGLRSP